MTDIHLIYEKFQSMADGAAASRTVHLEYTLVGSDAGWMELRAPVQHLTREVRMEGELILSPGDWVHRLEPFTEWYNVCLFFSPQDRLRGCYCDVRCPPVPMGENTFRCKDLLLDLWVFRDGRHRVLDRDEFEAARAAGWLTDVEYKRAMQTIDLLAGWAESESFLAHAWPAARIRYEGD